MGWIVLLYMLEALKWLIVIRAVLSWFASPYSNNPIVSAIVRVTDPILRPIARILPPVAGVDLSPLVAFFAIIVLQQVIGGLA